MQKRDLLHFVAFFHVASLFSTEVDNKKGEVDNEKALELTNSTTFIGVDNEKALELGNKIFFSYFSLISIKKYHQKMQHNILLLSGMIKPYVVV